MDDIYKLVNHWWMWFLFGSMFGVRAVLAFQKRTGIVTTYRDDILRYMNVFEKLLFYIGMVLMIGGIIKLAMD